jgi:hypothetical protein
MAKVLCVLYDDPTSGYPPKYARNEIPKIDKYPDGQTVPAPKHVDFVPGELLGCVSGELGLRSYLEDLGHMVREPTDPRRIPNRIEWKTRRHWREIVRCERKGGKITEIPNEDLRSFEMEMRHCWTRGGDFLGS